MRAVQLVLLLGRRGWDTALQKGRLPLLLGLSRGDLRRFIQVRQRLLLKIIMLRLLNSLIVGASFILIEIVGGRSLYVLLLRRRLEVSHWCTRISNVL